MKSLFSRYFAKVGSFRLYSIEPDHLVSISQPLDNKTRRSLDRTTYFFSFWTKRQTLRNCPGESRGSSFLISEKKQAQSDFIVRKDQRCLQAANGHKHSHHPQHLKVMATPISPEHPDNSFVIFESNENEENTQSRTAFSSACQRMRGNPILVHAVHCEVVHDEV